MPKLYESKNFNFNEIYKIILVDIFSGKKIKKSLSKGKLSISEKTNMFRTITGKNRIKYKMSTVCICHSIVILYASLKVSELQTLSINGEGLKEFPLSELCSESLFQVNTFVNCRLIELLTFIFLKSTDKL